MRTTEVQDLIRSIQDDFNRLLAIIDLDGVVSNADAADIMGCSLSTVSRYIREGKLHREKSRSGRIGIPKSEVYRYCKR